MRGPLKRGVLAAILMALALSSGACSIKTMAINTLGNALAEGTSGFAKDDDPELVRDAVPFALKTIESLIDQSPKHRGLLTAACSGFTQYGYAFVQMEADYVEAQDLDRATAMRARAKKLYMRALNYGMRALDLDNPGFRTRLRADGDAALAKTTKKDVALLYWTAAAWSAAFAVDVADSQLSVDQTLMEKMMRRALALDESWEQGSLHDFFISWEAGHASAGGSIEKAREHFERARALAGGQRLSPLVSYAEAVSLNEQNKQEFEQLLKGVVDTDVSTLQPNQQLVNLIAQRRAAWLLSRVDELFIE